MRVLIVEDEPLLREQLSDALRALGMVVDSTDCGEDALFCGHEYPIDVAVLDLGLPDLDGLEVLRRWRDAKLRFAVLVLTARGRWQEKVEALNAGADDYLTKPFESEELVARLRALVRRSQGWTRTQIECGPVQLDTNTQQVHCAGQVLELTAYEYRLLEHLMLHAGEVLSKTALSEHLYQEDMERDSNVLEVLVGRLRRKLDFDGTLQPIRTLRGRGYRFELPRKE